MNELLEGTKTVWLELEKQFVEEGGDKAKFWAGRLAIASELVINSDTLMLSSRIEMLQWTLQKYNDVIFSMVK